MLMISVDPEKGTGLVMCCTFGDKTDIIGIKNIIYPINQSIGLDGRCLVANRFSWLD